VKKIESFKKTETTEALPEVDNVAKEKEMSLLREQIASDTNKLNALRTNLGFKSSNEPAPALKNSIAKLKSFEDNQNQNENSEFSEEKRKELSDFFMESLNNEKKSVEEDIEYTRGLLRDSTLEASKGLMIFHRVVQTLSKDPRVPEKDRLILKIHEMNLSPVGAMEIVPGVNSYTLSIKAILSTLDKILTKEVSAAIHTYADKIFIPPAEDYAKHGPEPFDGTLFKRGE